MLNFESVSLFVDQPTLPGGFAPLWPVAIGPVVPLVKSGGQLGDTPLPPESIPLGLTPHRPPKFFLAQQG